MSQSRNETSRRAPWFERALNGSPFSTVGFDKRPWWVQALGPIALLLVWPAGLYATGSAPGGLVGPLSMTGLATLAVGGSLVPVAERARSTCGMHAEAYWWTGTGTVVGLTLGLGILTAAVLVLVF